MKRPQRADRVHFRGEEFAVLPGVRRVRGRHEHGRLAQDTPPAEVRAGFTGGVPRVAGGAQGGVRLALAGKRPHFHGVGRGNAQPRGAVEVVSQVHRAQGASGREYPRSAAPICQVHDKKI